MTIQDSDKLKIASSLDFCWWVNMNNQMKCQEMFQSFNRLWNLHNSRNSDQTTAVDDSVKFRNLLQDIIPNEQVERFARHQCLDDLAAIYPPIYNDAAVSPITGRPHNPSTDPPLPSEVEAQAITEHEEFRRYLVKVKDKPNSKNRREFRNKLCRLLYVVRSNIAHGSKINYEGSERNEKICAAVFNVILIICNEILGNGLYRLAAYGELKTGGALHLPLVEENAGTLIHIASLQGELIRSEDSNTLSFNPSTDYSSVEAEIFEFDDQTIFQTIDLVECMPRKLQPYYIDNSLAGFAWIYFSLLSIQNTGSPTLTADRHRVLRDKTTTFLYALSQIKLKYTTGRYNSDEDSMRIFGKLYVLTGNDFHFEATGEFYKLHTPFAKNLIQAIDDIGSSYRAIYNFEGQILPFSNKVAQGIETVHFDRKHIFQSPQNDEDHQFLQKDCIEMAIEMVAIWACERIGDEEADLWVNLRSLN